MKQDLDVSGYQAALSRLDTPDVRLFASIPWAPWKSGIALFIFLMIYYFSGVALLHTPLMASFKWSEFPFWMELDIVPLIAALHGYVYASEIYQRNGSLRDLVELHAHVNPAAKPRELEPLLKILRRRARIAAALGLAAGIVYVLFFTGSGSTLLTDGKIEPFFLFGIVSFPLLFANAGLHVVSLSNAPLTIYHHQYENQMRIDVLDRRVYRPYVRMGLRAALRWLILFGILMILLLDEGNNQTVFGTLPMILTMMGLSVLLASYEFVSPLLAARKLIVREKEAELTWVVEDIKRERAALKSGSTASPESARLSSLLDYKREVDALPDWPVESPDIGRFIIYLLIPAISWFGAAGTEVLVENIIR